MSTGKRIFVKPGEGRKPRNLDSGRRIETDGEWVNDHPGHRRLLKCGDLVPTAPKKESKPSKAADSSPAPEKSKH
jgi:hypothetical protein